MTAALLVAAFALAQVAGEDGWTSMFDGRSLAGWSATRFAGGAEARVADGAIVLPPGNPLSGVTWSGEFPRADFGLELEAVRRSGSDFFCGLTFPVVDGHATLVLGGWGGATVGLSCLDDRDASENVTTSYRGFERGRWYRVRVEVRAPRADDPGSVRAWVDDEPLLDVPVAGTRFTVRTEVEASRPVGVASFATEAGVRNVRWRTLDPPAPAGSIPGSLLTTGLLLAFGLALLLVGGDLLVRGASGLARAAGVSPMVVGLTVVAFGTSAPELAVNLQAAVSGSAGMSFGNVVGSNLANLGLILGTTAIVQPLAIEGKIITREIPLMLLATMAVLILALDPTLTARDAVIDRGDGLMLLLLFLIFLYSATREIVQQRAARDPLVEQAAEVRPPGQRRAVAVNLALVVVGLGGLVYGGNKTVAAAQDLAIAFGVSEAVVGLLVVAVGTSLPELATSVIAVRKGETDIAVGNVVGSNVFNLLLVLGTTATVADVPVPAGGILDVLMALLLSLLLVPFALSSDRSIIRREGAVLFLGWAGYSVWRFLAG